jgi:hypothetical protein
LVAKQTPAELDFDGADVRAGRSLYNAVMLPSSVPGHHRRAHCDITKVGPLR